MRQSRRAYQAECDVEHLFNANASVATAITDAAHEFRVFSEGDVFARLGHVDSFTHRAMDATMARVVRSGAARLNGAGQWEVLDEESLCDAVYSHAA